ncbi:MAG: hypothetical protein ABSD75_34300 [Terriglobales bacterium]
MLVLLLNVTEAIVVIGQTGDPPVPKQRASVHADLRYDPGHQKIVTPQQSAD